MSKQRNQARDIMVRRIQVLAPDAEIPDAVHALLRKGHSGAPVVTADGELLGVFSEYDCIRGLSAALFSDWPPGTVRTYMTKEVETVSPETELQALATQFVAGRHRRLLVVDKGKLVGLISRRELVRTMENMLEPEKRPLTTYEILAQRR